MLSMTLPAGIYIWAINTEPVDKVSWIAFPLIIFTIGGFAALLYARKDISKSLQIVGITYMMATVLVFAWLFPAIDSHTSMQQHKQLISTADHVVAYQNFNDAFVFYTKHPILIIDNVDSLNRYMTIHPDALVLSRDRRFTTLDSLPALTLYSKDMDLFSLSYSAIYTRK